MNEQKTLMQKLWLRAFKSEEPIVIPCGTKSDAMRFRFAMYDAVKETRKPDGMVSAALREAAENCQLSFNGEDKTSIVVQRKTMTNLMKVLAGVLGEDATAGVSEEAEAAAESAARVMAKLGQLDADTPPVKKNPYY